MASLSLKNQTDKVVLIPPRNFIAWRNNPPSRGNKQNISAKKQSSFQTR
jgi:hypothetical protein